MRVDAGSLQVSAVRVRETPWMTHPGPMLPMTWPRGHWPGSALYRPVRGYISSKTRIRARPTARPSLVGALSLDVRPAFKRGPTDDVIAVLPLARPDSVGLVTSLDIDVHDPDEPDATAAMERSGAAQALICRAGLPPPLGHLGAAFCTTCTRSSTGQGPRPGAARVQLLARGGCGLATASRKLVEAFPKQPSVPADGFNWLRLVGRHHTRDVWASVFDGSIWLTGATLSSTCVASRVSRRT